MHPPRRAARRVTLLLALTASSLIVAVPLALAYVTSDLVNWNLTESTSTYGGGTSFHISSGTDGRVDFRWLDSPNKTTVISANACGDYALYGSAVTADTNYRYLFTGGTSQCFLMRGRTAAGSGPLYNHDGRVQR